MTAASEPTAFDLAPDPALPRRDVLLTSEGARDLLARHLGVASRLQITGLERLKAKYRIGESLRVLYRVGAEDRSWLVAARMSARGGEAIYRRALAQMHPCGRVRGVAFDATTETVLWTFPNDRKLAAQGLCGSPSSVLQHTFPGARVTVDVVSYTPERAAIGRVTDEGRRALAYAKVYADDSAPHAARTLNWLHTELGRSRASLVLPKALACDQASHMLVVEPVSGVPLAELDAHALRPAFARLGVALAALHQLTPPPVERFVRFDGPRLRTAARLIGAVRPDLEHRVERLWRSLMLAHVADTDTVCVHGDVNSRNWLVRPSDVALIDLDQAALGPAAADLGGALALLRYRTITGAWDAGREADLSAALLDGYAGVRPVPSLRSLAWHAGAALFVERGLRSVTRVRPEGLATLDRILADAEAKAAEVVDA